MEDTDEQERMKQWVRETEARRRPRPREHQLSQEDINKKTDSLHFQECLDAGKQSERYVAEKLLDNKFTVRDISMERSKMRGLELFSPFDLLVSSEFYLFAVDVKCRKYNVPIGIPILKLDDYESYSNHDVVNKIIVFHFPIRRGHQDCFFMQIKDIRTMCHIVGPFYHIELYQLIALTTKGIINKLEPRYPTSTRL